MNHSNIIFISPATCPFKFNGRNLAEMRCAKLAKVARDVNAVTGGSIDTNGIKNDMLTKIIAIGKARSWEPELSEMFVEAVAKVEKKVEEEKKVEPEPVVTKAAKKKKKGKR